MYFVQENGAENLEQKHQMVATMEQYLPEDAIIASSSSGTPVTKIASEAKHPERIIVAHPFNPAYLLPLIEICGGEKTDPAVIQQAIEFYKMYDKAPVYVKIEKNGFIANRLMHALWREEIALVTEGVCSMADADDAWTFGPGIRLAAFGPAMNYELGGGDLGLKGCAIKFGAMTNAVFADISDMKAVPDTWADQSGEAEREPGAEEKGEEGDHLGDQPLPETFDGGGDQADQQDDVKDIHALLNNSNEIRIFVS